MTYTQELFCLYMNFQNYTVYSAVYKMSNADIEQASSNGFELIIWIYPMSIFRSCLTANLFHYVSKLLLLNVICVLLLLW